MFSSKTQELVTHFRRPLFVLHGYAENGLAFLILTSWKAR